MFGVVIWSDHCDRKAVFWCEDQGDLAFYDCGSDERGDFRFFDTGDMVKFDVKIDQRLRRAHNAELVHGNACAGLPESLRRSSVEPGEAAIEKGAGKVLAFVNPAQRPAGRPVAKKRKA